MTDTLRKLVDINPRRRKRSVGHARRSGVTKKRARHPPTRTSRSWIGTSRQSGKLAAVCEETISVHLTIWQTQWVADRINRGEITDSLRHTVAMH